MTALGLDPADVEHGRWVYSAYRHLSAFAAGQAAMFEATSYAGKAGDLLGRLRGLGDYTPTGLRPLATDAGITARELRDILIPAMETLGIVATERRPSDGSLRTLRALVLGEDDVMAQTARLWHHFQPEGPERTAIHLVRDLATLPLTREEALSRCVDAGIAEEDALQGLDLALAHHLVFETHVADHGVDLLFNDFLWGEDIDRTTAALAALPADVRDDLRSLLEELHRHEGRPAKEVESARPELVKLAVVHGLIEETPVRTSDGKDERFLFTPRFRGYGIARQTPSATLSQIRLVMASFGFATRFARFKLYDPEAFLGSLLSRGHAGNATPIGTDYGEMEKQKIVAVEPMSGNRFRFVAIKRDTLEQALDSMRAGALLHPVAGSRSGSGLFDQRFTDPITNRVHVGQQAERAPAYDRALLAAVRDTAQGTTFGR